MRMFSIPVGNDCSKLTIETLEQGMKYLQSSQWRRSGVFIVNFDHISHLVLSNVYIVNFEQVNACWHFRLLTEAVLGIQQF